MPSDSSEYSPHNVGAAQGAERKRTIGQILRSFVTLTGIWMYFLLSVCIPGGIQNWEGFEDSSVTLVTVGSGMVAGCAFVLCFFALWGFRHSKVTRIVAMGLMVLLILGGILLAAGRGQLTKQCFDRCVGDKKTDAKVYLVGLLIGEVAYVTAGVLVVLPDLGVLV